MGRKVGPVGKYDALVALLARSQSPVTLTFGELARVVGGLPASARTHRSWWGNTSNPNQVHAAAWVNAGWMVKNVDLASQSVTFATGKPDTRPQRSDVLVDPDGAAQLAAVLTSAGYPSTMHAVAAHTTMLHPAVVAQTSGQAVFATVRRDVRAHEPVGSIGEVAGRSVMFDDNRSATVAFTWAAGHGVGRDMQYNHIWPASRSAATYTALWNLCATPAFLAKTTDGRNHPEVVAALRCRAFDLYGCLPAGTRDPIPPDGYDELSWANHPPPVDDLEVAYRTHMLTKPKDRVVVSAREIGWVFSDWRPDVSV